MCQRSIGRATRCNKYDWTSWGVIIRRITYYNYYCRLWNVCMFSVYFCLLPQIQGIWISWEYFLNSVTEHFPNSRRFISPLHNLTHLKPAQTSRLQLQRGWGRGGVLTGRIQWKLFNSHFISFYCLIISASFLFLSFFHLCGSFHDTYFIIVIPNLLDHNLFTISFRFFHL